MLACRFSSCFPLLLNPNMSFCFSENLCTCTTFTKFSPLLFCYIPLPSCVLHLNFHLLHFNVFCYFSYNKRHLWIKYKLLHWKLSISYIWLNGLKPHSLIIPIGKTKNIDSVLLTDSGLLHTVYVLCITCLTTELEIINSVESKARRSYHSWLRRMSGFTFHAQAVWL